jgi:hypothetical protein
MPDAVDAVRSGEAAAFESGGLSSCADTEVASFWLHDPAAREVLNEQLAELLRVIVEGRDVSAEAEFAYCLVCGSPFTKYDQDDIWVQGLRCDQEHLWVVRGGRLFCSFLGQPFGLHSEPSEHVVKQLVRGWLNQNPLLEPQLHESVRRVLATSRFGDESAV